MCNNMTAEDAKERKHVRREQFLLQRQHARMEELALMEE